MKMPKPVLLALHAYCPECDKVQLVTRHAQCLVCGSKHITYKIKTGGTHE